MAKAVVIISGGLDSCTLAHKLKSEGHDVYALSFFYGQRHRRELKCAEQICNLLKIPWKRVDIKSVNQLLKGSALTDDIEVPKGHYSDDSMAATVVPSRNTFLLAIASAYAVSIGAQDVFFGAHAGDRAQYMDCKREYVDALNGALAIANTFPVKVHAPFLEMDKGDIAIEGLKLGVPFEFTWTCYLGKSRPCLKCGSCVERTSSFLKANTKDALLTDAEWKRAVKLHNKYQAEFDKKQLA